MASEVPPLVLAVSLGDPSASILIASRNGEGVVTADLGAWPRSAEPGLLFLYHPSLFPWDAYALAFFENVEKHGGAVFPLGKVLKRMGLSPGRGIRGLERTLIPDYQDLSDPEALGRRLVEALAERFVQPFTASDTLAEPVSHYRASAVIQDSVRALPDAPGVYWFLNATGETLYVGKAASLRRRVSGYFTDPSSEPDKSRVLARDAKSLNWEASGCELEALVREYRLIARKRPCLNRQVRVHLRARGPWRNAKALLALPSADLKSVEICLVSGAGRFHWETVGLGGGVPRGLWGRLRGFLETGSGWAPGEPGVDLAAEEAAALAEIALSWLAVHGDTVSRIDLRQESPSRLLQTRLRRLLNQNPRGGRIEVRS